MEKECIIALLLVNKGGKFATNYGLCKVLSLFFNIINCSEIIKDLINNQYIEGNTVDGISYFSITKSGNEAMNTKRDSILLELKAHFPDKIEFISYL